MMTNHAHEMDNQERKQRHEQARSLHDDLKDKYGTIDVSEKFSGADEFIVPKCPSCGGGILISERPSSYPQVVGTCDGCGASFNR